MKELSLEKMECVEGGFFSSGANTMSCIGDAYSNHGWLSVALFVESAFIPATALVIAGACAAIN